MSISHRNISHLFTFRLNNSLKKNHLLVCTRQNIPQTTLRLLRKASSTFATQDFCSQFSVPRFLFQDFCSIATLLVLKRLTGRVCSACCERRTALIAPGLPISRQVKQQHTVVNRGMMELLYAQRRRREPWNDGVALRPGKEFDRRDSKTQTQTQASGASWCCCCAVVCLGAWRWV